MGLEDGSGINKVEIGKGTRYGCAEIVIDA